MSTKKQFISDLLTVAVFLLITVFALFQIPRIRVDSSVEVFIPEDHEVNRINDRIEEEFGTTDAIIVGIKVNFGSVLEPEILQLIDSLTAKLKETPSVDSVLSLTNMDYIRGTDEGMEVIPILEDLSPPSIDIFRKRLVDWKDVYYGTFISENKRVAAIIVQPAAGATPEDNQLIYNRILELTEPLATANLSFPVAGFPVVKEEIKRAITSDLLFLIPVVAFLILLILYFSFRRWEGVLFPLLGLAVAALWVTGLLALLDITLTMATLLVPVLLLVVGSAYGIHVISHLFRSLADRGGFIPAEEVRRIIGANVRTVLIPVLLAGLTTAGGFASLLSSPLGPFRAFGMLSAVGVLFSQLAALVLVPALLRIRFVRGIDVNRFHKSDWWKSQTRQSMTFKVMEHLVRRVPLAVLLLSVSLTVLTIALIPRIHVGTDMLKFFKEDSRLVEDTEVFNRDMSGSQIVTVMINAPEPGDILDPIFLTALDGFDEYLRENSPNARKIQTLVPNIKRINRLMNRDTVPYQVVSRNESIDFFSGDGVLTMDWIGAEDNEAVEENLLNTGTDKTSMTYDEFAELLQEVVLSNGGSIEVDDFVEAILAGGNYDGAAFNEIPSDPAKYGLETREELRNLLSQYLVLYSGNLSMVINDALEPDKTLITVQIDNVDQSVQQQLLDHIKAYWDFYLPEKWSYEIGGGGTLAYVLSSLVTRSQLISLLVALVVVWLIVSIMFRSPVAGFLGLIPVAFALVGIFLFMILFGFSLDIVTSILASLAIGIGVDYSIHVMDAFRRSLAAGIGNTLQEVYSTTGKAVFINALSVAVGFMGLLISRFVPIQQMAVLFSVAMIFACGASLVVLPLVLLKLDPKFLKKHMTNKPPTALPERLDNILVKEK